MARIPADKSLIATAELPAYDPGAPGASRRDRASLVMLSGTDVGRVHSLGDVTELGRHPGSSVVVDDESVSRRHAQVRRLDTGQYEIVDLESRNGTFVNGRRVTQQQLEDGDRIQLGTRFQLRFVVTDAVEEELYRRMHATSVLDPLTGAMNRRQWDGRLEQEVGFALKQRAPICLLLCRVDGLSAINARYGNLAGDRVLRAIKERIGRAIRKEDLLARWEAGTFSVLARGSALEGGAALARRIVDLVRATGVDHDGTKVAVTVSIGLAQMSAGGQGTAEQLESEALASLGRAEQRGGDGVDDVRGA